MKTTEEDEEEIRMALAVLICILGAVVLVIVGLAFGG